jgi:hypothetical protein
MAAARCRYGEKSQFLIWLINILTFLVSEQAQKTFDLTFFAHCFNKPEWLIW